METNFLDNNMQATSTRYLQHIVIYASMLAYLYF